MCLKTYILIFLGFFGPIFSSAAEDPSIPPKAPIISCAATGLKAALELKAKNLETLFDEFRSLAGFFIRSEDAYDVTGEPYRRVSVMGTGATPALTFDVYGLQLEGNISLRNFMTSDPKLASGMIRKTKLLETLYPEVQAGINTELTYDLIDHTLKNGRLARLQYQPHIKTSTLSGALEINEKITVSAYPHSSFPDGNYPLLVGDHVDSSNAHLKAVTQEEERKSFPVMTYTLDPEKTSFSINDSQISYQLGPKLYSPTGTSTQMNINLVARDGAQSIEIEDLMAKHFLKYENYLKLFSLLRDVIHQSEIPIYVINRDVETPKTVMSLSRQMTQEEHAQWLADLIKKPEL